jgi:membrane protein YdbS with pleckstrin-like domain
MSILVVAEWVGLVVVEVAVAVEAAVVPVVDVFVVDCDDRYRNCRYDPSIGLIS